MKAYLSLDLDFFNHLSILSTHRLLNKIKEINIPVVVVSSHEQMLNHINENPSDILYNVDYHSDFLAFESEELKNKFYKYDSNFNCGTWGVYVKWSKDACFYWMAPEKKCFSYLEGYCWINNKQNPYSGFSVNVWRECKKSIGYSNVDWKIVKAVGISISPDYLININKFSNIFYEIGLKSDVLDKNKKIYNTEFLEYNAYKKKLVSELLNIKPFVFTF